MPLFCFLPFNDDNLVICRGKYLFMLSLWLPKEGIVFHIASPFWKTCIFTVWYHSAPCRSTGFILEGFPHSSDEVDYMLQQQLFPDLVVIMEANISEVQKRLLPGYLKRWHEWQNHLEEQIAILRDLRKKNRVGKRQLVVSPTEWSSIMLSCVLASQAYHFSGGENGQKKSWNDGGVWG